MNSENLLALAPFSGRRVQKFDGERRFLATGSVQNTSLVFESVIYEDRPSRADIVVNTGDILFARMRNTDKVLLVAEELDGVIVSTGFSVHRPIGEKLLGQYLLQYLKNKHFQRQKDKYCTGAVQPAITNEGLKKIQIPLPPLDDQIRIANILTRAEKLIAKRRESIKALDELLKSTFLEMFGDPVMNNNRWEEKEIIDACKNKNDIKCGPFGTQLCKSEFQKNGIPLWGIPQINSYFKICPVDFLTTEKAEELSDYSIEEDDIVMSRKGTVGKCALYPANLHKGVMHSDVLRIRIAKDIMNPTFLCFQLRISKKVEKQIDGLSKGAIMAGINVGKLKSINILFPPPPLQNQFAAIVKKAEALKVKYTQSLTELENLYGSLSQRAFKGELDLSKVSLEKEKQVIELHREVTGISSVTGELPISKNTRVPI